jgi:hypothetical protein
VREYRLTLFTRYGRAVHARTAAVVTKQRHIRITVWPHTAQYTLLPSVRVLLTVSHSGQYRAMLHQLMRVVLSHVCVTPRTRVFAAVGRRDSVKLGAIVVCHTGRHQGHGYINVSLTAGRDMSANN